MEHLVSVRFLWLSLSPFSFCMYNMLYGYVCISCLPFGYELIFIFIAQPVFLLFLLLFSYSCALCSSVPKKIPSKAIQISFGFLLFLLVSSISNLFNSVVSLAFHIIACTHVNPMTAFALTATPFFPCIAKRSRYEHTHSQFGSFSFLLTVSFVLCLMSGALYYMNVICI